MKKREITKRDLQQMRPPMPAAFEQTALETLHNLPSTEEDIIVKKKISVSLVFALVLILVAVAAFAATILWDHYAVEVKQTEQEKGYYEDWPASDKVALVRVLADMGYIEESDEVNDLLNGLPTDDEIHRVADQLLMNLTHRDLRDISLIEITESLWGPYDGWSHEKKAWWQNIEDMDGPPSSDAIIMVAPGPDSMAEEDAILIAKLANIAVYDLAEDYFDIDCDVYTELYVTPTKPDEKRWYVQLTKYLDGSKNNFKYYWAAIDAYTGFPISDPERDVLLPMEQKALIDATPDRPTNELYQAIDRYYEQVNHEHFRHWPLELRAAYSQEINPMVQAVLNSGNADMLINGDGIDMDVVAHSTYTYGMPGAEDISRDEALRIAKETLKADYGFNGQTVAIFNMVSTYFDITDLDQPLWKFLFRPDNWKNLPDGADNPHYQMLYKVEMDARTGEITHTEAFRFQSLGKDLDYDLKWY